MSHSEIKIHDGNTQGTVLGATNEVQIQCNLEEVVLGEPVQPETPANNLLENELTSNSVAGETTQQSENMGAVGDNRTPQYIHTISPQILECKLNAFPEYLAMINTYSGREEDGSVEDFISGIEEVGKLAFWGDTQLIIAAKMKVVGEAASFSKTHPIIKRAKSWEEVKSELIKRFGKIGDSQNNILKFTQASQKHSESTRGFLSRLSGLAHTCFPDNDKIREDLLFNQALKGLNSSSRRFIMSLAPKTFGDIWQAALQEEQCLSFDRHNAEINVAAGLSEVRSGANTDLSEIKQLLHVNMTQSDRKISELEQQVKQLTLMLNQQSQPPITQPTLVQHPPPFPQFQVPLHQPPPFNQNQFHTQYPQQYFPRQQTQNFTRQRPPIVCYTCGKVGHISRVCRNKGSESQVKDLNG